MRSAAPADLEDASCHQPAARLRGTAGCPASRSPCALVIFGVTGDLARKKLIPAVYDLANRGLLPPGFVVLGFARRDWGDGDFEELAREAAQEHARTAVAGGGLGAAGRQHQVRARARSTTTPPSTSWPRRSTSCAEHARHPGQRGVLPVDPAGGVPGRAQADAAHRHGRQRAARRLAAGRGREAVRPRPGRPASELNELVDDGLHRRRTSSASTTTWARRRSRTCWRCASPTRCSSRCGTPTTSTRCRSRWPRTSASAAGPASTTTPAPPATCCRTTCCSCSR